LEISLVVEPVISGVVRIVTLVVGIILIRTGEVSTISLIIKVRISGTVVVSWIISRVVRAVSTSFVRVRITPPVVIRIVVVGSGVIVSWVVVGRVVVARFISQWIVVVVIGTTVVTIVVSVVRC
jgi:hypothetical protein